MHLNALYRAAQAGKHSLQACVLALEGAKAWLPLRLWRLRQARQHFAAAKDQLVIVRDNVSLVAALGEHHQIDSSGGYAVADLLCGGLLDKLAEIRVRSPQDAGGINDLVRQVEELMLRMRKAGAVG